jgi:hypothetical protein
VLHDQNQILYKDSVINVQQMHYDYKKQVMALSTLQANVHVYQIFVLL